MDSRERMRITRPGFPEELPSLIKHIASKSVEGFDNVEGPSPHSQSTSIPTTPAAPANGNGSQDINVLNWANEKSVIPVRSPVETIGSSQSHSVSISLPSTPLGRHVEHGKRVLFADSAVPVVTDGKDTHRANSTTAKPQHPKMKFNSQPMPIESPHCMGTTVGSENHQKTARPNPMKDKRYDSFKTWSGKLERQLSNLRGKPQETDEVANGSEINPEAAPRVDRYFDALEGPELETLRSSEVLVLPEDKKWPFLLRFPVSSFGMCLGASSQAMLWKALATSPSTSFLHVSLDVNLVLWCISLSLMVTVSLIYSLKIIFYFEAVRREYYHPIRVNFFFAPWIACLFLAIGVPPSVTENLHGSLWYVLMAPIFCLELKIYGQWMSGGQRRLSKVANPSNHLSIVGNFVGALLGASMGLKEGPIFFFAVGLAHYIVLFVTLYQRLPTNETLPKELHPVFFLFVAAPSVASMAWAKIQGEFDCASRIAYFIALFLYASLAIRINFFRGFRFSLAWWAYTFPMTGAAIATIRYSNEVESWLTQSLSVGLSAVSTLTITALLFSTIIHAFVLNDLFPNDISIAITDKRSKLRKKHSRRRSLSSDTKDIETSVPSVSIDIP